MDRLRPAETPEPCPFGAADAYREVVKTLRESLEAEDIAAARPLLRDLIGPITAVPTESNGVRYLTAHFPAFSVEGSLVGGLLPTLSCAGHSLGHSLIQPSSHTVRTLSAVP